MKQSKLLAEAEATSPRQTMMPSIDADDHKFIQQQDGVYRVYPITCFGDYIAIAPFQRQKMTSGGIVVPSEADVRPDTGLIVGLGVNIAELVLGLHVKFIPKHQAADLTGEYPAYGDAQIAVYKAGSIIAILPQVDAVRVDA